MDDLLKYNNVYITTTLPYVNASPHVGFAMEIIRADVLARFLKNKGKNVFFNTGTDEHGQKIHSKALEAGIDTKKYVDNYAKEFKNLKSVLNLYNDIHFIRTTDKHHIKACQDMWNICKSKGYIYQAEYEIKYCIGCEMEKSDSELIQGYCPEHPNLTIKTYKEKNYFFKFSSFQKQLLKLYKNNSFLLPNFRLKEVESFVEKGLKDFSISRLSEKMPWGVPVPNDPEHVMYVWFDALTNYISTLGWPEDMLKFTEFWQDGLTIQFAGKDNLRQQSAMWQAMLMAADLPSTKKIVINGFITGSKGQKMSKSLGNVINPYDLVNRYGTDALRYYLLRHISTFEDSPMTEESFHQAYISNLVNGLGNLVNRILTLSENANIKYTYNETISLPEVEQALLSFDFQNAIDIVWQCILGLSEYISREETYKVIKTDKSKGENQIMHLLETLNKVSNSLHIFLPETAEKIRTIMLSNKKPTYVLFPRIDFQSITN